MNRRAVFIVIVSLVALLADQGTKQWARHSLRGNGFVEIVADYLALEYHENPGMAFGLGRNIPGARFIFIGISLVVLYFVWRAVRQIGKKQRVGDLAFGLVIGGAVGNLIDRIYIGRVVDFIIMHWHKTYQWPAYNIADAELVVGIALLLIIMGNQPKSRTTR